MPTIHPWRLSVQSYWCSTSCRPKYPQILDATASLCLLAVATLGCRIGYDPLAAGNPAGASDAGASSDAGPSLDSGGAAVSGPPLAAFTISPAAGVPGTPMVFDASASRDWSEDPDNLIYEWDWNGDRVFDESGITATHRFDEIGEHPVTLRVTDGDGSPSYFQSFVISDPDVIVVTTANDLVSDTDGVTSLREAIIEANTTLFGGRTIAFARPTGIRLTSPLPTITANDITIVGGAGVSIDGGAVVSGCLSSDSLGTRLLWLDVHRCVSEAVVLTGQQQEVAHCVIRDNDGHGMDIQGSMATIGPSNAFHGNTGLALKISGVGATILGNSMFDNGGAGVEVQGFSSGLLFARNTVAGNGQGIVLSGTSTANVWHNTFYENRGDGIAINMGGVGNNIQNNIFVDNRGYGISGGDFTTFFSLGHNNYFTNTAGSCAGCPAEPASLAVDPQFVNAGARDLRILPGSPCRDAATPVDLDLNGSLPGLFHGAAPDIGASEVP